MDKSHQGFYFGRFQPFSTKHLDIVRQIIGENPDMKLSVCVAGWTGERDRNNFLFGEEVAHITRLSLLDVGLDNRAGVLVVELRPEWSLEESIARVLPKTENISAFSGSDKTLGALEMLTSAGLSLRIVRLEDDDVTPPRSREIRESLLKGNGDWMSAVTDSTAQYLSQLWVRTRIMSLPEGGTKRPWASEGNISLPGSERR